MSTATLKPMATDVRTVTVEMTSTLAMDLLSKADPNRTVHERRVGAYARDMIAKAWEQNGETVKLAPDGKLMDGEHRLWAVVRACEAGIKSVPMLIATNVPRSARKTVDTGKPRSYTDVLRIRGYSGKGRTIAGILRYIVLYRAGALQGAGKGNIQVTHSEMDAVYTEKATIQLVEYFAETWASRVRYGSATGFVWWRARQDDEEKADNWIEGVASGTEMKGSDPRFQLRERYLDAAVRPFPATEAIALAIKSWNLYYTGTTEPNLRWRQRGNAAEGFPAFYTDDKPATDLHRAPGHRAAIDRRLRQGGKPVAKAKADANGR